MKILAEEKIWEVGKDPGNEGDVGRWMRGYVQDIN